MVDGYGEARAGGVHFKGLGKCWTVFGIQEAWIHSRCQDFKIADGSNNRGL